MATVTTDMCTSDTRARIMTIAKAYNRKLSSKHLEGIPSELIQEQERSVGTAALTLAKYAFATPRRYFFVAEDMIPTQCLHIDLLSSNKIESIETSTELIELLSKSLSDPEALLWSFAPLEINRDTFNQSPPLKLIRGMANLLSQDAKAAGTLFSFATAGLEGRFVATPNLIPIFGDASMPKATLYARLAITMYMMLDAFDFDSRLVIANRVNALLQDKAVLDKVGEFLHGFIASAVAEPLTEIVAILQRNLVLVEGNTESQPIVAQTLQNLATVNGFRHPEPIPHTAFYVPSVIDAPEESIKDMFIALLERRFSLIKYPALIDAATKSSVLQLQALVDSNGAARQAMVASLFSRTNMRDYFLCLSVKRDDLVRSTLLELQRNLSKIRSPLRVNFVGEDGIDEGGVRKEFFQLLCKELLSLDFGMFQETPSSHALWPVTDAKNNENRREFWLIGMVIGLAVFNNVILDVRFPSALFKKLLRVEPSFVDLEDLDPELAKGLDALLTFQEGPDCTIQDVFARTFTYEYELYGAKQQDELCPDGANVPLTAANRGEYVRLLTRHLLTQSIYSNFEEFRKGFDQVCDRDMIRRMHPKELELLICGNPVLDFRALEESTTYDGFDAKDDTILQFWEVVHALDDDSKRNFLRFCTGSDRVPIRGLADLHFVIGKNGGDGELLPTSHTCFNHLLLPVYGDKETLKKKLLLAIHNCHGFGLR